jgi:uncharacterized membrane protein
MSEPALYKKGSMKHAKTPYGLILRRYWVSLVGVSLTWFIYDFIVYVNYVSQALILVTEMVDFRYPFGIYSSTVVDSIIGDSNSLYVVFGWNVVINLFYMPGTLIGAFVVDYLGPKWTIITGLVSQALIGFIMSGLYSRYVSFPIA